MQQFRFQSHEANLFVGDLDALSKGAQVIPPVAAAFRVPCVGRNRERFGRRMIPQFSLDAPQKKGLL